MGRGGGGVLVDLGADLVVAAVIVAQLPGELVELLEIGAVLAQGFVPGFGTAAAFFIGFASNLDVGIVGEALDGLSGSSDEEENGAGATQGQQGRQDHHGFGVWAPSG